jgi:hypothetical protein
MKIQFRFWDGRGDETDPKVGTPATGDDMWNVIHGKKVNSVGGASKDTDGFMIGFENDAALWFDASRSGIVRVLIVRGK